MQGTWPVGSLWCVSWWVRGECGSDASRGWSRWLRVLAEMPVRCQRRSLCSCVGKRGMRSEMRKERSAGDVVFWGVVLGLTTLLLLYLFVPFGALFPRLSLPDVLQVVQDLSSWRALGLSAVAATFATVIAGTLGIPFGYVLARKKFKGAGFLRAAVLLPLVMTPVVGGLLLLLVVGPGSVLGGWLEALGVRLTGSWTGVVLAQTFAAAPFVVITAE